jgi:hypothetical protein
LTIDASESGWAHARIGGARWTAHATIHTRRNTALAAARLTRVNGGAGIAIAAHGSIGLVWICANGCGGVACSSDVTLVERGTNDGIRSGTCTRLTGVSLRTAISIIAGRTIRLDWIRAHSSCRVARSRHVALIERRANNWIRAGADANLTSVGLGTSIGIIAGSTVGRIRVRTNTA